MGIWVRFLVICHIMVLVLYPGVLALESFFSARGTPFSDHKMAFSPKMRKIQI